MNTCLLQTEPSCEVCPPAPVCCMSPPPLPSRAARRTKIQATPPLTTPRASQSCLVSSWPFDPFPLMSLLHFSSVWLRAVLPDFVATTMSPAGGQVPFASELQGGLLGCLHLFLPDTSMLRSGCIILISAAVPALAHRSNLGRAWKTSRGQAGPGTAERLCCAIVFYCRFQGSFRFAEKLSRKCRLHISVPGLLGDCLHLCEMLLQLVIRAPGIVANHSL